MAAKGYGTRARGLDSFAVVAPWRHGAWTEAAGLQLCAAEEDAAGRASFGAVGEAGGAEDNGRGRMGSGDAQDESSALRAGQIERGEIGAAGRARRESQSGTGEPQHGTREACGQPRLAAV